MNFDSYLEPPFDPKEPFFEKVLDLIPDNILSTVDYEANEQWFINLIDKLYEMCPIANPKVVSDFVVECWKEKLLRDQEQEYLNDLEYPDFHFHSHYH